VLFLIFIPAFQSLSRVKEQHSQLKILSDNFIVCICPHSLHSLVEGSNLFSSFTSIPYSFCLYSMNHFNLLIDVSDMDLDNLLFLIIPLTFKSSIPISLKLSTINLDMLCKYQSL